MLHIIPSRLLHMWLSLVSFMCNCLIGKSIHSSSPIFNVGKLRDCKYLKTYSQTLHNRTKSFDIWLSLKYEDNKEEELTAIFLPNRTECNTLRQYSFIPIHYSKDCCVKLYQCRLRPSYITYSLKQSVLHTKYLHLQATMRMTWPVSRKSQ